MPDVCLGVILGVSGSALGVDMEGYMGCAMIYVYLCHIYFPNYIPIYT